MEPAFWVGDKLENFLFSNFNVKAAPEFIGVCFITAAIALVFEGTRTVRDWLYLAFLKKRSCHLSSSKDIVLKNVTPPVQEDDLTSNKHKKTTKNQNNKSETISTAVIGTGYLKGHGKTCDKPTFYVGLFELSLSTLFHVCQVLLGYILMLQVMTFNLWIFIAVLSGTGVGFFMFDSFNKKIQAVKLSTSSVTK